MKPATFVTKITPKQGKILKEELLEQGFILAQGAYMVFSAKKPGIAIQYYESGKLVVQGKRKEEFIEFFLEPEVLGALGYTHPGNETDNRARIGIDESGKGDFFGPLVVAGVFADKGSAEMLVQAGVKDSKLFKERAIFALAKEIKKLCSFHVVKINPLKYNELYQKFRNLNDLLAWGHATAIAALAESCNCKKVIIDQFAHERVVKGALERKNLLLELEQRTKGEEDPVVAAASILAREQYLRSLEDLREKYGVDFPRGISARTLAAGREFVKKFGKERLPEIAKMHFKTLDAILS